ncbi:hypothetical protein EBS80_05630, partial [bacterium]|nr:hypothetical protein [bacterium]
AALEKRVADLRADRDEAEADVTYVQGQIETERERLEEKQQAYQNWDVVVQQFTHYAALDREPDYHFYVRSNGVYSSASTAKWTKAGLKAWLTDVAAKTPPGSTTDVVFYIENGANDLYIYERSVIDELNASGVRIVSHSVILPPGVRAGPDEMIHANQGGGK